MTKPPLAPRRYLELLRGPGGVSEATWAEVRGLADIKFQFRDKLESYSYASSLSHCMQVRGTLVWLWLLVLVLLLLSVVIIALWALAA